MNDLELPPCRSLNEFLTDFSRYQIPNINQAQKWGNRVVHNLLYYQTNYLLMSITIFLSVGLLQPLKMLIGMLAMLVILGVFAYVSTLGPAVRRFKTQYPIVSVLFVIVAGCFVSYTLGSMLLVMLGILLSICITFIHASLRLRDLKNKLANKIESMGLTRTPMGVLLEYFEDLSGMAIRAQTSLIRKSHN